MLQSIRNNTQSLFAKIIVGLIALTFALWGVDAIVGGFNAERPAVTVNGEDITEYEVANAVEIQKRQLYARFGDSFDPSLFDDNMIRSTVIESLISTRLLAQDATAQDMYSSDAYLNQMFVNAPVFQVDGKFSEANFDSYLRSQGLTRTRFWEQTRQQMLVNQVRSGLMASAFSTEDEALMIAKLEQQHRDYAYTTITRSSLESSVELTDEQIENFYDDNRSSYKTEEQIKIEYIQLDINDYTQGVDVTDESIQALYDESVAELETTEERKASHILVTLDDLSEDEAVAKVAELKTRIEAGESFEELAKEFSQDPGSAKQGGDLGFAGKGTYVEPFENALYELSVGQMSDPIVTQFGVHLIKLVDVRSQDIPTLEELRPRLEQEFRLSEARNDFVAAGEELASAAYSTDTLAEAAEELSLKVVTSDLFTREGGSDLATSNSVVINTVFDEEFINENRASDLIELSDEISLVVRVVDYQPAEVQPLEEVKEQVVAQLTQNQAQLKALEIADALLQHLRSGESLESFEGKAGLTWSVMKDAARTDASVNASINNKAFSIGYEEGALSFDRETITNGDVAVIRLDKVVDPENIEPGELVSMKQYITGQNARVVFDAYQNSIRERAEIER
jgi:peptidyl-prolyl cis-trans isomerase D